MVKQKIPLVWFEYFKNLIDLYPLNTDKVVDKFLDYGIQCEEELNGRRDLLAFNKREQENIKRLKDENT